MTTKMLITTLMLGEMVMSAHGALAQGAQDRAPHEPIK